jgi:hypothetical protein
MTSSKRVGTGMFGWCIDDLHDKCIEWFTNSDRRCTCDCHSTRRETHVNSVDSTTYPEVVVPSWTPVVEAQVAPVVEPAPASDPVTASTNSSKVDARAIRAWAKSQGIEVGARGRIKPELIARYNEAHGA